MHGLNPGSPFLVNAEVDSMGGVIDGGALLDIKSSPRCAAIEKAQAELQLEFDVREERRRELEFLEKGGNPLDFKAGPVTSISIQSTSVTDQHTDHEAKGSFALAVSPHGDSVDSSARPLGRESTTADNLLLFDGEKDALLGDRNVVYPCEKGHIVPQEQSPQLDRGRNVKETEEPQVFRFGARSRAYARRNRSRSSRDNAHAGHSYCSSMIPSSRRNSRDAKGSIRETHLVEDHFVSSICNSKTTSPNTNMVSENMFSDNPMDIELVPEQGHEAAFEATKVGELECKEVDGRLSQVALDQCPDLMPFTLSDLEGGEHALACLHSAPSVAKEQKENSITVAEVNGSTSNMNENVLMKENQNNGNSSGNAAAGSVKFLDSEFHCSQVNGGLDENLVSSVNSDSRKVNGSINGSVKEQTSLLEMRIPTPDADVEGKNDSRSGHVQVNENHALSSVPSSISNADVQVKVEENGYSSSDLQTEMVPVSTIEGNNLVPLVDNSDSRNASHDVGLPSSVVPINCLPVDANHSTPGFTCSTQLQMEMDSHSQLPNKKHEDAILEEARAIEARHRRIRELCSRNAPSENRRKSYWDIVLEEMAWLANDFMQERVWKMAAAAQISHWAAFSGRAKFTDENVRRKQRKVAHTLAKSVLHFWHSVEMLHGRADLKTELHGCNSVPFVYQKENSIEPIKDKTDAYSVSQGISKSKEGNEDKKSLQFPIHSYVLRLLKYSKSVDYPVQADAPMTPDQISDTRFLHLSWEDQNSEESLFYTVPPGAMEYYRKSVESHWAQDERVVNALRQEEFETSGFDSMAEFKARETVDGEDNVEIGIYYPTGGFESCKSSKSAQRTKKTLQKSYVGPDLPHEQGPESKLGSQPSPSAGKRPSSSLNNVCSIPTKRVRTAARQRVVSPFGAGVGGSGQLANKTDASSGDTSSFHDDQTSVHVGSHQRKILEVESTGDFVKQLPFDATDSSAKPKKKKPKHMGYRNPTGSVDSLGLPSSAKGSSTFEQRWQINSMAQCEQRDHLKKRLDGHPLDSNGSTGMYGQHAAKKPKILTQLPDASLETANPVSGSIPSPVASQMSNMSNPNKFIKMIASRDRGRKTKALKISAGQTGSGCPWSVYEDQALVVLVHDMGPNWELVSDAINSCLQFKCIFRKPKECKERHKELMDRNSGDGADSAEDSGSSQPYPSTLPGIPKGSARQLFQRLQGPMEEETLKAHFEKIILIGQQLHSRKNQNTNLEGKQISTTVHSSHILALSQACPYNLNGAILMPLDLCDATMSSPDVLSPGYLGSLNGGLAVANHQGSLGPVLPASGSNPMLQGSSGMVLGNSLSSPSATVNAAARDVQRYGAQGPSSLPVDEQQRMQQYSQLLSNRNIQHSNAAVSGAMSAGTDRGVRMPPGASGMGMMCGMSRGLTIPRPAFQGIGSPSMINMAVSGNVLSPNGIGMPSSAMIPSGAVSGQVNPMMRPHEALQMLRPGQNPDEQRQMMIPELQMQVTQGSGPSVIPYSGLNTTFSKQTVHPPVQTFPVQHQQQQQMPQQSHVLSNTHHPHLQGSNHNPHQQSYVIRLTKENHQLQQRLLHQQQFASPNSSIPHSQPQLQHAMSPLPNNSQIQQQSSAQSASLPPPNSQHPITAAMNPTPLQAQQKQHHGPQGLSRTPQTGGALTNQMLKQQQRQQLQQQPRQHPQQRQQSQQQAKLMKGIVRGSMLMHQNLPADASHVNGISPVSGIQIPDKGEQPVMHLMQGNQGLYPGSSRTPVSLGKQLVPQPSNPVQQQKMFSRPLQSSSNQQLQTPHLDRNQGQMQVPSNHEVSASHQPRVSSPLVMTSQQQQKLHGQTSQTQQAVQRVLQSQTNRQTSSDTPVPSQGDTEVHSQLMNSTFQMGTGTVSQCAVPSNVPGLSSATSPPSQWKEPAFDANTVFPTSNLPSTGTSLQSNASGSELMPSSGPRLVSQGHYSGNVSVHGHNVCVQWQQPQQQLHRLPQQQQQGQGPVRGSHAEPSVSGPG